MPRRSSPQRAQAGFSSTPSYPKTRMQAKSPFLRRKETILAGNFIGLDHLQTVDLAPIMPSSILNSGIQTRGVLRRKAGCLGMPDIGKLQAAWRK